MSLYDAVRYSTHAKSQTHPDRLATLAALFGLDPAPVTRCRVLELGCGTGANLVPMALGLEESEFLGIDLAADPIAEGNARVRALGLGNITLRAMDLTDFSAEFGAFDYIIAHGLFSWVPAEVREKILSLCREHLAPRGVAFISYNALPGFHLRSLVREMLRYHVDGVTDPDRAIGQAGALLNSARQALEGEEDYPALRHELEETATHAPGAFFHDDLAAVNTPFYLHQFLALAGRHGLQYLGDADFYTMQDHLHGERVAALLRALSDDPVRKEQYLDFLRCRRFRQTLLCHAGPVLEREVAPGKMRRLWFSSLAQRDAAGRFRAEKGATVNPVHPLARAALTHLSDTWPRRSSFAELLEACGGASDGNNLCEILLGSYAAGLIEPHVYVPRFVVQAGPSPVASPLARLELRDSVVATNLCHRLVEIKEERGHRLIQLLDGTRDRAALAAELGVDQDTVEHDLALLARSALLLE